MNKEKPPLLSYEEAKAQGLWFVSKRYGYGWTPFTWQGWIVTLLFVLFVTGLGFFTLNNSNPTLEESFIFLAATLVAVIILFFICYKKGEKPYWRWGK
jgi:hypothetical protein